MKDAGRLRRGGIGLAVALVHALLAFMLYASFAPRRPPPEGATLQLLHVELIEAPPQLPVPEPVAPDPPAAAPSRTREPESPSAFVASGSVEQSGDANGASAVIDAFGFDARLLTDACAHAYPESAADLRIRCSLTSSRAAGRPRSGLRARAARPPSTRRQAHA